MTLLYNPKPQIPLYIEYFKTEGFEEYMKHMWALHDQMYTHLCKELQAN